MKKRLLFILVLIGISLIVIGCIIEFVKKNNNADNNSYNEIKYLCYKSGQDITTSTGIKYHLTLNYQFTYNEKLNDISYYNYYVEYKFDTLKDFNDIKSLPSIFKNMTYIENNDSKKLIKTLSYGMKLNFKGIDKNNYLNSYIEKIKNDGYKCIQN